MIIMKEIIKKNNGLFFYGENIAFIPLDLILNLSMSFNSGSETIIQYLGKKYGRFLSEKCDSKLKTNDINKFSKEFLKMVSLTGWGNFSLISLTEGEIKIKLLDNVATYCNIERDYICSYILGILTGYGEYLMENVKVSEIQCSIKNQEHIYCEFLIQKKY